MSRMWKLGQAFLAILLVGTGCGGTDTPLIVPADAPIVPAVSTNAAGRPATNATLDPKYPIQAQPRLRTMKVWIGGEEIIAEVAATEKEVMTGMMGRNQIGENEGMLFVFRNPDQRGFWMKNCLIPLSCAYIDPDGIILETYEMSPFDEKPLTSKSDRVQYVIECKEGWFKRHNIGPGVAVRTDRGSLAQTFFGGPRQP